MKQQMFLAKLQEFLNAAPKGENEKVNWDELAQYREAAQMSIDELSKVAGGKKKIIKPPVIILRGDCDHGDDL